MESLDKLIRRDLDFEQIKELTGRFEVQGRSWRKLEGTESKAVQIEGMFRVEEWLGKISAK